MSADLPSTIPDQAAIRSFLDRPAVAEVLSLMCFETVLAARLYRLAGHDIPTRAESEQAFVMRRALQLICERGDDWRRSLGEELAAIREKAVAEKAAATSQTREQVPA